MSRVTMLVRLMAVVLCAPPAASAMESAPGPDSAVVIASAQPPAADGASTMPAPRAHRSGGAALAIGLGATVLPAVLGAILDPAQPDGQGGEVGLALGITAGVFLGPAVGLASGRRGDLAWRGVAIRGVGGALLLLGAAAAASTIDSEVTAGANALMWLGVAGGGAVVISSIYDLVITPGAVDEGRRVSFRPLVTPNGMVGLRATF
jgi:hypothetical protein